MFGVKWVAHGDETHPIEKENSLETDLGFVVLSCQERLPAMRKKHAKSPPDGFIIFDASGNEARRWFGAGQ